MAAVTPRTERNTTADDQLQSRPEQCEKNEENTHKMEKEICNVRSYQLQASKARFQNKTHEDTEYV